MAGRRTRERVTTPDGVEHVQTKAPRADVLHYPAHDLTTVLVRRTHNPAVARPLAEDRWAALEQQGLVDAPLGVDDRAERRGWWQTGLVAPRDRVDTDAVDDQHRTVRLCSYDAPGAGAGIEYRP